MAVMNDEELAAHLGRHKSTSICPVCRAQDELLLSEVPDLLDHGVVEQRHHCCRCNSTWRLAWKNPQVLDLELDGARENLLSAESLRAKYEGLAEPLTEAEHPEHRLADWQHLVSIGHMRDGYWEWVHRMLAGGAP